MGVFCFGIGRTERTIKEFQLIRKRQQIPGEGIQPSIDGVWPNGKFLMFAWLNGVRFLRRIGGEKIGSGDLESLTTFDLREASQIDGQVHGTGSFAIQHE
jgi:hypothetical protein